MQDEPNAYYYELPDFVNAGNLRTDAYPPSGGGPGSDPDFAFKQLMIDAKVDIGILVPLAIANRLPEIDRFRFMTINNWLVEKWLTEHNKHGRWRGSISVCNRDPLSAALEVERLAGHPMLVQVSLGNPYTGKGLGDPVNDPLYAAAVRHGLPVACHINFSAPFEFTPISPVGQGSSTIEWLSGNLPLLFASQLMSLVFDGTFERFPDLQIVFIEAAFSWALPILWRMDAYWEARRSDVPMVKRKPSEYVQEHVRFTTQPLEDPANLAEYKQYIEWLDPATLLMFSSDYPHAMFDDSAWAAKRFSRPAVARVMSENAIELYNLPRTVTKFEVSEDTLPRTMVLVDE